MSNFIPSEYQKKIFDFVEKGVGNAVINAKAGSGKTTTLIETIKLIPNKEKILFIVFNKSIEEEISKKVSKFSNVDVKTYHSLGFSLLSEKYEIKLNIHKYKLYVNNNIEDLSKNYKDLSVNEKTIYINNILFLIDYSRYNLAQSPKEINNICKKYGINTISDECFIVSKILKWGIENCKEIDYVDMVWLCFEKNITSFKYRYDFIFIDEAQDSSIMQQNLIKKCYKRGTRFIAIGDEFQCINAFAGADINAFKNFQKEPNTVLFDLPITYRCPINIVNHARKKTNVNIFPADNAIEGEIFEDVNPFVPQNGDLVLCRNTAPLISLYMKYNQINKKSYLKGRNIGEMFETLIKQTHKTNLSIDLSEDGVFSRLYLYILSQVEKEINTTGLSFTDVIDSIRILDLFDAVSALKILSEGLSTSDELLEKIKIIFSDGQEEGICLSTVHKAKGLEADNVFILCNSLMPSKYAKKEWEKESEQNLIYVAITRAKKTLKYISEKEFSPDIFMKSLSIEKELKKIKEKINLLYNKNF